MLRRTLRVVWSSHRAVFFLCTRRHAARPVPVPILHPRDKLCGPGRKRNSLGGASAYHPTPTLLYVCHTLLSKNNLKKIGFWYSWRSSTQILILCVSSRRPRIPHFFGFQKPSVRYGRKIKNRKTRFLQTACVMPPSQALRGTAVLWNTCYQYVPKCNDRLDWILMYKRSLNFGSIPLWFKL